MVKGHVLKVINEMQCYKLPGAHLKYSLIFSENHKISAFIRTVSLILSPPLSQVQMQPVRQNFPYLMHLTVERRLTMGSAAMASGFKRQLQVDKTLKDF